MRLTICDGKILKPVLPDIFVPPRWFVQMLLLSIVAKHLGFALKTLVAVAGQTVRKGVFHLQHINAPQH